MFYLCVLELVCFKKVIIFCIYNGMLGWKKKKLYYFYKIFKYQILICYDRAGFDGLNIYLWLIFEYEIYYVKWKIFILYHYQKIDN